LNRRKQREQRGGTERGRKLKVEMGRGRGMGISTGGSRGNRGECGEQESGVHGRDGMF
jgi:hypothetical protein